MPAPGNDTIVRRYADAMERRSNARVTLRRVTRPGPSVNPPTVSDPVLDGARLAGATVIAIRAAQAVGRLAAGDRIQVSLNTWIAVAADAASRGPSMNPAAPVTPGFDAVTLASGLPAPLADGTPLSLRWACDLILPAVIASYSLSLRETGVLAGDLSIVVAGYGLATPSRTDHLIVDGKARTIIDVTPVYHDGLQAAHRVHAR